MIERFEERDRERVNDERRQERVSMFECYVGIKYNIWEKNRVRV